MGQFLASLGMTPMAGRMWGWLLICDPPEQTAAEIAEALQRQPRRDQRHGPAPRDAGLIRRTTRRGDRREYFSAPPEALDSMLVERRRDLPPDAPDRRARPDGHGGRPPEARARLQEFHDVMAFVEVEVPRVIGRFLAEREAIANEASARRAEGTGRTHQAA